MLDFTSALYLGLHHAHAALPPWRTLTAGVPAALAEAEDAVALAEDLAAWIGCERATLVPSTLHAFWDLFGSLVETSHNLYWDAGTYPIARWGIERAAARGVSAVPFAHHDPENLERVLRAAPTGRPIVVTDGLCPACGRVAPLRHYRDAAALHGGFVVVDDTQALGLHGVPAHGRAYGRGGGGSMRWCELDGAHVVVVASLAKALGAPVAVLAGPRAKVARFENRSETRTHCSPPSMAAIAAARRALAINEGAGDALRARLARNVRHFATGLRRVGHRSTGGTFPVQRLTSVSPTRAPAVHDALARVGVRAVLQRARCGDGAHVAFVINARHDAAAIDQCTALIAHVCA